jgi:sortase A
MKKKTKLLPITISVLLLCAGLFFALYPTIRNKINLIKQNEVLESIEQGNSEITIDLPKDKSEIDHYNIDKTDNPQEYIPDETIASINGIGILEIKSIDLRLPVIEGVEGSKLKVAPGHVSESVSGGEVGNCIIAGHRNYEFGQMFNRLNEVRAGDVISYKDINGNAFRYKVYGTTVILPSDNALFDFEDGQKKLTLLTCTPVKKATHRLLILANLME